MTELFFSNSHEANALLVDDPFALLVGFALDQQVTVQQAFLGPLRLKERLGTLEPRKVADADLEPLFREKPAIHRFPEAWAGLLAAELGDTSRLESALAYFEEQRATPYVQRCRALLQASA